MGLLITNHVPNMSVHGTLSMICCSRFYRFLLFSVFIQMEVSVGCIVLCFHCSYSDQLLWSVQSLSKSHRGLVLYRAACIRKRLAFYYLISPYCIICWWIAERQVNCWSGIIVQRKPHEVQQICNIVIITHRHAKAS